MHDWTGVCFQQLKFKFSMPAQMMKCRIELSELKKELMELFCPKTVPKVNLQRIGLCMHTEIKKIMHAKKILKTDKMVQT